MSSRMVLNRTASSTTDFQFKHSNQSNQSIPTLLNSSQSQFTSRKSDTENVQYIYVFFLHFVKTFGIFSLTLWHKMCPIDLFASISTCYNNWTGLSPYGWFLNVIMWEVKTPSGCRDFTLFDEHSYQTVSYVIFTSRFLSMLMSLRLLSRVHLTPAGLLHGGRRGSQTWLWASAAGDGDGRLPAHHTQTVRRAKLIPEELKSCLVNGLFSGGVCKIQL